MGLLTSPFLVAEHKRETRKGDVNNLIAESLSQCQQQSYSGLRSPRRSNLTYFWNDSWVQTFHSKLSINTAKINSMLVSSSRGARVAQWWEYSPPINVARVQLPASTPYVGWVCSWFSPLLRGTPVFPSPQNPTLPNSNSIWKARAPLNEFIWTPMCFVGKQATYIFYFFTDANQR